MTHPLAGQLPPPELLTDIPALLAAYRDAPDPSDPRQRVSFGTSGHRGSSLRGSFNAAHVAAIAQAIAEHRKAAGITGPLYIGADTHALSDPAARTAAAVFARHGVDLRVSDVPTATPLLSHAVLAHWGEPGQADGVLLTPSHNPPGDGGLKYNPPHGGPASGEVTGAIERRAGELLGRVHTDPGEEAAAWAAARRFDFVTPYVESLGEVLDMAAIANSGLRLAANPLGGAALFVWERVAERWGLDLTLVSRELDPAFAFMPLDHDGVTRMDCSSPFAMRGLRAQANGYDLAFGTDPDADRHGVLSGGELMEANRLLAVCADHVLRTRPGARGQGALGQGARGPGALGQGALGKTVVTSRLLDRVASAHGRAVFEVPVGFKFFVPGLLGGALAFAGEESAGASLTRKDGTPWTTDKDGIVICLLAAEASAAGGALPHTVLERLHREHGEPFSARRDAPATLEAKARLAALSPADVRASTLAGEPIAARLSHAPGDGSPIGGLKVETESAWFAARPSGTEALYKIYAESFRGPEHLGAVLAEAQALVDAALSGE